VSACFSGKRQASYSTITQPPCDIGREAAKILLRAAEKKQPILSSQSVVLESTLFARRSTVRS
jgi:LacI family transcriptional regulator